MVFLYLPYVLQLLLIIHAIRNGKSGSWIWLLIMLPVVGGLAYLFLELLPDLRQSSRSGSLFSGRFFSRANLGKLRDSWEYSKTPANQRALADAYFESGDMDQAIEHYGQLQKGWFSKDPAVAVNLSIALLSRNKIAEAYAILESAQTMGILENTRHKLVRIFTAWLHTHDPLMLGMLEELFARTADLETGYYVCRALVDSGQAERVPAVVAAMKDQVSRHRQLKSSMETAWIKKAQKLSPR